MNQQFDKQEREEHAKRLLEAEIAIADMSSLCEGLDAAVGQMGDKHYISLTTGAIGLMTKALNEVYDIISDIQFQYRMANEADPQKMSLSVNQDTEWIIKKE